MRTACVVRAVGSHGPCPLTCPVQWFAAQSSARTRPRDRTRADRANRSLCPRRTTPSHNISPVEHARSPTPPLTCEESSRTSATPHPQELS
ncbi:hypothetical protein STRAU_3522 [Streptomyces aurantiacus JA 4570]|uniref:Uncharacterized protein n=1 Tax=Streptomyces aurantiacus JA 4570 TaxID=1286094 RepID=S3ZJQ7_9ACTN|nr:hypothetical protein STRAU_3522 [Streptomyces aurantiacus JA 4570]